MSIICPVCKRQHDITLFQFGRSIKCDCGYLVNADNLSPVKVPIDGILDLHTFKPSEIKDLIPEYIQACSQKGIFTIRIIHGKGTGALRRKVHSILRRIQNVESFKLAGHNEGGWGATIIYLKRSILNK